MVGKYLFRPDRGVLVVGIVIATLTIALAGIVIRNDRQDAFEENQRDLTNLAVVLAEQTARYVQTVDLVMTEVKSWAKDPDSRSLVTFERSMRSTEVHQLLVERPTSVLQTHAVVIVGADGEILNSSRSPVLPGVNIADKDYFQYLKGHNDPALVVGLPAIDRTTNRPSLFFARRVSSPDGAFLGLVVGVVDAAYLGDFYRSISERLGGAVTLLRRDGVVLLRYPDPRGIVGRQLVHAAPWFARVAEGGGTYRSPGYLEGAPSVIVAQPLSDYPLVVNVMRPDAVILAPWRREAAYIAAGALAAAVGCIIMTCIIAGQFRRQQRQNAKLSQTAASLHVSEQRLRTFAEMSADWFWEQDTDLQFLRDANIPLTSHVSDIGKTRWDFADVSMSQDRWDVHIADLTARRPFRDFRWERIRTDGKRMYMSTSGDPIFDEVGAFMGYQGTGRDISADVEAAEQLRIAKDRAEAANRAKSEFLTNMTHELRTPLNAIIGFSELIHDQEPDRTDSNHMEWSEAILSSGRHLLDIVNKLLELARIEAGHYELASERIMLSAVVPRCLVMVAPQAGDNHVRVDCHLLAGMGQIAVRGDNRAMKQIVLNLMTNAIKFTPAGGVVSIRVDRVANGGLVIVVADTGIGIDPVILPSLGEPFIQADASISRRYGGTGLGLAISRKLMELHGGTLTIESILGDGTTVRASFPAARIIDTQQQAAAFVDASV